MGFRITSRNFYLFIPALFLSIYSFVNILITAINYSEWNNSLFRNLAIDRFISSTIMFFLGLGLIRYSCLTNGVIENQDYGPPVGIWEENGITWKKTNGGLLFWLNEDEEWEIYTE